MKFTLTTHRYCIRFWTHFLLFILAIFHKMKCAYLNRADSPRFLPLWQFYFLLVDQIFDFASTYFFSLSLAPVSDGLFDINKCCELWLVRAHTLAWFIIGSVRAFIVASNHSKYTFLTTTIGDVNKIKKNK